MRKGERERGRERERKGDGERERERKETSTTIKVWIESEFGIIGTLTSNVFITKTTKLVIQRMTTGNLHQSPQAARLQHTVWFS